MPQTFLQQIKTYSKFLFRTKPTTEWKYLIRYSYYLHKGIITNHQATWSYFLDSHSSIYEVLILGDFNVQKDGPQINLFLKKKYVKSLIKPPTYYKNLDKSWQSTCIDLIFTIEAGLSDFHLMTLTILRKTYKIIIKNGLKS